MNIHENQNRAFPAILTSSNPESQFSAICLVFTSHSGQIDTQVLWRYKVDGTHVRSCCSVDNNQPVEDPFPELEVRLLN
jgi:hypothetical protein